MRPSATESWDFAVESYCKYERGVAYGLPSAGLGREFLVGVVVRPHRLFLHRRRLWSSRTRTAHPEWATPC